LTAGADSQTIGMGMVSLVRKCLQNQILGDIQSLRFSYLHAGSTDDDVKLIPSLEVFQNNKLDKKDMRP